MKSRSPAIALLVVGVVLISGGVYGIYYQAPFWTDGVGPLMTAGELAYAFGLPTGVTVVGVLLTSFVILRSRLTESFCNRTVLVLFILHAVAILMACRIASRKAGSLKLEWYNEQRELMYREADGGRR